ncbi:uncharacterized protein LOC128497668 [Spea bombifrons]|uniref:uncharacterized protein LOC128497668 n=1 Tax=Spea bombifrons TaxID=233779 RepID=UPI00234A744C|nr:uncharacterized protein LOC128497668 [Spea bombifrons]
MSVAASWSALDEPDLEDSPPPPAARGEQLAPAASSRPLMSRDSASPAPVRVGRTPSGGRSRYQCSSTAGPGSLPARGRQDDDAVAGPSSAAGAPGRVTPAGPVAGSGTAPQPALGPFSGFGAGRGSSGGGGSSLDLERGRGWVLSQVARSLAPSTLSAYTRYWQDWEASLREVGGPASREGRLSVLLFVVGTEFSRGVSVASITKRLAALAFYFKMHGEVDLTKEFLVSQAMKGYRRGCRRVDSRRPVTFDLLGRLCVCLPGVCFSEFEVCLFRLSFVLAFFGAFRVSELVSPSTTTVGGLLFSDVLLRDRSVSLLVRRSKTDQLGRGFRVCLFGLEGSDLCPVRCLRSFLAVRPPGDGPLLVHVNGSSLSRFQFLAVFRKCLLACALNPGEFGTHSFRIGAATQAARWGLGFSGCLIWILGHSYVYWAARRASVRPRGRLLGLDPDLVQHLREHKPTGTAAKMVVLVVTAFPRSSKLGRGNHRKRCHIALSSS